MGTGYEQSAFYQLTFRQAMFVLKYKTLDSQMRIGNGYVGTNVVTNTGGTESWGMDCENIKKTNLEYMTDSQHHVKCFGIEDFWGNMQEYVDGVKSTNNYKIMTTTDNFNDAGTNYIEAGETGITAYESGYMSAPCGTTKTGFVMKAVKGSSSTYFCDSTMLSANVIAHFGGSWASGVAAGLFNLVLTQGVGTSHNSIGARLMYL